MYFKCSECGKRIRRSVKKNLVCRNCSREKKFIKCLNCGSVFYPRVVKRKYCSPECSSSGVSSILKGRKLSISHRENLSRSANNKSPGYVKCKFYSIYNPYRDKMVAVQGTYELGYAKYLNYNGILWDRGRKINMSYSFKGIRRTYFPDFYLISDDKYIEIKGYFFGDDGEKMSAIINQNTNKKIDILFKNDLVNLGIIL